jgi:hypothetical protein
LNKIDRETLLQRVRELEEWAGMPMKDTSNLSERELMFYLTELEEIIIYGLNRDGY